MLEEEGNQRLRRRQRVREPSGGHGDLADQNEDIMNVMKNHKVRMGPMPKPNHNETTWFCNPIPSEDPRCCFNHGRFKVLPGADNEELGDDQDPLGTKKSRFDDHDWLLGCDRTVAQS